MKNPIVEELKWRGFLGDTMGNVEAKFQKGEKFYLGIDPTSIKVDNRNPKFPNVTTSTHIGHFSAIITAMHLQRMGMEPVILIGGASAKLGDATGKLTSRPILSYEEIANNVNLLTAQIQKLFNNNVTIVNNDEWYKDFNCIDFLRNVGQYITVNYLMAKDSVKHRFERDGQGINISEFSYPLIQSYDWLHLYDKLGCKIELCGLDQTGNVSCTFELARKSRGIDDMAAWFIPLVTDENGNKFGKSENNKAVFLDKRLTSVYDFYQFWINQSDAMAEVLIKKFTFLSREEIETLIEEHKKNPSARKLQKVLAKEVTTLVHSEEDYNVAVATTDVLFGGKMTKENLETFDEDTLVNIFTGVPTFEMPKAVIEDSSKFLDSAVECGAFESKGSLRKLMQSNGISINKVKINDTNYTLSSNDLIKGKFFTIQQGKKKNIFIKVV